MTRKSAPVPALPTLQKPGGRILLRPITSRDAKEFVTMHRASRAHFGKWTPATLSIAAFRKNLLQWTKPGSLRFVICLRDDGRIIGDVALSQISMGRLRSAYMGYAIGAAHAGQGYMHEAVQLALKYAFRTLKLNRVEANIQPANQPSITLAQRLGFTMEGYSRRYLKLFNTWRDHQRWTLLATDWKPGRKPRAASRDPEYKDDIEIRDLGLHDIGAFAVLRHQISTEGNFMLAEPAEALADKEKFAERVAQTLADPAVKRILALSRGRAVGFVIATRGGNNRNKHAAHLAIGIAKAHAGKGIGTRLMAAIEAWARSAGVVRLDLRVVINNEAAIALYLRRGFCIEGRARGEFFVGGKLVDTYVMGKILD
jgi:ribosomal-protein-alanine N-acetyltransferase